MVESILAQIPKPVNSFKATHQYLKDPVLQSVFFKHGIDMTPLPPPDGRPKTLSSLNAIGIDSTNKKKLDEEQSVTPNSADSKPTVITVITVVIIACKICNKIFNNWQSNWGRS
jgi:hypothetical protein